MEAKMILQDPPVENPCLDTELLGLSSSQTGDIEEGNSGGFPTGYAGCGKPLSKVGGVGDPASLRTKNQRQVTRPVENPCLDTELLGLRTAQTGQVPTGNDSGFPTGLEAGFPQPLFRYEGTRRLLGRNDDGNQKSGTLFVRCFWYTFRSLTTHLCLHCPQSPLLRPVSKLIGAFTEKV
jgi:hypothetical protein